MNLFTPIEIVQNYADAGKKRVERTLDTMLLLSVLAGLLIAFGGVVTNTAAHAVDNVSAVRIICGLLFPFGLGMVVLSGAELFTGNCLICISVLERKAGIVKMLRNWMVVYIGNFIGALILAAGCAFYGQMNYSGGELGLFTMKLAAAKCTISFPSGIVLGFFCNVLVCMGVICSTSAKDTVGRILGAYIPVSFFVVCGFEHSVANMYYIPAGLFAARVPQYAHLAAATGLDVSSLTWGNFLLGNLLPVTIGNILGGIAVGMVMWYCHVRLAKTNV